MPFLKTLYICITIYRHVRMGINKRERNDTYTINFKPEKYIGL